MHRRPGEINTIKRRHQLINKLIDDEIRPLLKIIIGRKHHPFNNEHTKNQHTKNQHTKNPLKKNKHPKRHPTRQEILTTGE